MNDFSLPEELWELPSSPLVVQRLLELIPLSDEKDAQLLEIVGWDPALTVRIIAAARSIHPQVSTLEQAAGFLGEQAFRLLALQFSLDTDGPHQAAYGSFWRRYRFLLAAVRILCESFDEENAAGVPLIVSLAYIAHLQTRKTWSEVFEMPHPALAGASITDRFWNDASNQSLSKAQMALCLDIGEAAGNHLVNGGEIADASLDWKSRLEASYQRFQNEAPNSIRLDEFLESTRKRVNDAFPAGENNPSSSSELLSRANRELGRLAIEQSRKDQAAKSQALGTILKHEKMISQLEHEALRDPLTEIYNRRFFLESLRQEAARCRRRGAPIGLLFLDVDAFKALNDTWGHLVGDLVLKQVGATLKNVLREADVLARFGGEEFVVLPNDPNEKGMLLLAERLRTAVENLQIPLEEDAISVTISVGCTLTVPKNNDEELPQQLLASADAAMYDAKQMGRNQVVFRSLLDDSERELMQQTIDCSFSRWLTQRDIVSEEDLEIAMMDYAPERVALGELAIEFGFLTNEQVAEILRRQAAEGERFGTLALRQKWIMPEQLAFLLARQRENPNRLARLLVEKKLLKEKGADRLIHQYLADAMG